MRRELRVGLKRIALECGTCLRHAVQIPVPNMKSQQYAFDSSDSWFSADKTPTFVQDGAEGKSVKP